MKVNEIFYSLQGEGYHAGTAAVFVRLSGCNLQCPFCDTQHESGSEMTEDEIVAEVAKYPARLVVVTGGEPSLQLTRGFVNALHDVDKMVAVETNGTHRLPGNVDWITLSPKDAYLGDKAKPVLNYVDEIKVVLMASTNRRCIPASCAPMPASCSRATPAIRYATPRLSMPPSNTSRKIHVGNFHSRFTKY